MENGIALTGNMGLIGTTNRRLSKRQLREAQKSDDLHIVSILQSIKNDLESLQNSFDFVTEPELIDSYTHEIMALKIRYCYYLNLCKERGLTKI